jgi:hypothetical protein
MKGNVNPFEPWRPQDVDVPPPLHASRPWRPPAPPPRGRAAAATEEPPLAELADPPRNKPPQRPARPARLSGPPLRPLPARRSSFGSLFVLGAAS